MACLDLHYYVTVHEHVQGRKQEKREAYTALALSELQKRDNRDHAESVGDVENSRC